MAAITAVSYRMASGETEQQQIGATIAGKFQLLFGHCLLFVRRTQPNALGFNRNLKKIQRFAIAVVELTVSNARAGTHTLDLTGPDHRASTEAIFMFECSRAHVRDDLHIPMAMGFTASAGDHAVFIDPPKVTKSHILQVVIVTERESMSAVEPVNFELDALIGFANLKHCSTYFVELLDRTPVGYRFLWRFAPGLRGK